MHKCVGKPENRGNRENAARFSLVSLGSACQHARPRLSSKSDNIEKTGEGVKNNEQVTQSPDVTIA
eukprot:3846546-Pyramimonas_sp.AAC.1